MAEAATRPCWRYAQDNAEPRAGVGKGARGGVAGVGEKNSFSHTAQAVFGIIRGGGKNESKK